MKKKIELDEVKSEFKNDNNKDSHPTSWYLGIETEEFSQFVPKLKNKMRKLNADMDWWFNDLANTELGIMKLGPEPRHDSASIEEIIEGFDFNYEKFMMIIQENLQRDYQEAFGNIEPENVAMSPLDEMLRLRDKSIKDKPLWIVKLFKEHGKEEISIERWLYADFLFYRIKKAEACRKLSSGLSNLSGGL